MGRSFFNTECSLTDDEVIAHIKNGDYIYLGLIIDRYTPLIKSITSKFGDYGIDSDDLFQEATLALCNAIKVFDGTKSSFAAFASVCITRAMGDIVKSVSAKRRVPENMLTSIDDIVLTDGASPETILIEKESYLQFADNIRLELSTLEYHVLCLFLADKSYLDIANELNISVKSVDNTLRRIRTKLKSK